MITTLDIDALGSGERLILRPRRRVRREPVIFCGGMNNLPRVALTASYLKTLRKFVEHGFAVHVPYLAATWNNAAGQTSLNRAAAQLKVEASDPAATRVILVGASHGAGSAIRHAQAFPSAVACVVGTVPALNWGYLRTSDALNIGLRAALDAAWGVVYPAALPAGVDPSTRITDLTVPTQLWVASNDLVSSGWENYAARPNVEVRQVGALGHTDAAIAAWDPNAVLEFVETSL